MTKVFIGGSRAVSRLDAEICRRLDNIVRQELPVLVGDANGADKAVQKYLFSKSYENVEVFCSGAVCRNNVGGWRMRKVAVRPGSHGAGFYSEKDRAMAKDATVGLMIWDGESAGTLLNVFRLAGDGKTTVLYTAPGRRFTDIGDLADWDALIASGGAALRRKVEDRIASEPDFIRAPAHTAAE